MKKKIASIFWGSAVAIFTATIILGVLILSILEGTL
jgi:hypothetical protein